MKHIMYFSRVCLLVAGMQLIAAFSCFSQNTAQPISLVPGWNAVYIQVTPDASADDVFKDWPVESVGMYDSASFLRTAQYSASGSTDGIPAPPVRMWNRRIPSASSMTALIANAVYICYATNSYSTEITGMPEAPRMSWHKTGTNDVLNYFGIAVEPGKTVLLSDYLSGLDVGNTEKYKIGGTDRAKQELGLFFSAPKVRNGDVVAMNATELSDWTGVLFVKPFVGVDFGTNSTMDAVSVRNDGAGARTVSVTLTLAVDENPPNHFPLPRIMWRDAADVVTNGEWKTLSTADSISRRLDPKETMTIELAVDRSQFQATVPGTKYAGLLVFKDEDGGSFMRAVLPLSVVSDGGNWGREKWPAGLWNAEVKLTQVSQVVSDTHIADGLASGGNLVLRLPLHVDVNGNMTLLQRVIIAGTADENGKFSGRLYTGEADLPQNATEAMRISTVCLPTDVPVINGTGEFGRNASFAFTVGPDSPANPLRHPLHPDHDGLRWDFTTPAPSGDVLENYTSTVKPELFSITNRITLTWDDADAGIAPWNPAESLSGTCSWEFSGLRREGTLRSSGKFIMKRISNEPALVK